jgi:hypothetical protein
VLCPNNNVHRYQNPYHSKFRPVTDYEVL